LEAREKPAVKEHSLRVVSKVINRVVDEIRATLFTLVLAVTYDSDCGLQPASVAHSFLTLVSRVVDIKPERSVESPDLS